MRPLFDASYLLICLPALLFHPPASDFHVIKQSPASYTFAPVSFFPKHASGSGSNASHRVQAQCADPARSIFPLRTRFADRTPHPDAPSLAAAPTSADVPDNLPKASPTLHTILNTQVQVTAETLQLDRGEGFQRPISPREVETSAGTFGDLSRFLQTLAGVTSDNDQRNDVLVRGGNPSENLFMIDNIEIPSINQLALSDTTGGFVSMLDANAIQSITLHTDAYDSRFEQRLSSVIEISTRPEGAVGRHSTSEVGIAGIGGSSTRPLGQNGSLFLSGRHSVLNYFTNDIGLNGVPKYDNAFLRAETRIDDRNSVWGISLTGIDSIDIHPSTTDSAETNPFDVHYSGWRNTTGINWQHQFSPRLLAVASAAHAEQQQSVLESGQLQNGAVVYNENTRDGISTAKYDLTFQPSQKIVLTSGLRTALDQLNYSVAQPVGLQNPYSQNPSALDVGSLARQFATFSSSAYAQAAFNLPHGAQIVLGERAMDWALGGHTGATGKALLSAPILHHLVHIGFAQYQQMPPTLYLLSFNNLRTLSPIESRQLTAGILLADNPRARVTLEAYDKTYTHYPVSASAPQLSLANVADTFGQAFLLFPMVGSGKGLARGVELTVQTRPTSRLTLAETLTYSRTLYTGLDGVWRRGNFDFPLAANLSGVWALGRGVTASARFSATSGKPYTPDNLPLSLAQNRDVYDLTRVNALCASSYQRLDFRLEQSLNLGRGVFTWHSGLQNALNRNNFYSYVWQPLNHAGVQQQSQMPLLPDGGFKFAF